MSGNPARWLAIINPVAGGGAGARLSGDLAAVFAEAGLRIDIARSPGPGEAARLAGAAIEDGYDVLVAVGGDGTVNEVANGMVGSAAALAIYPVGTGNDFARTLGYPRRRRDLAAFLARATPRTIDAGMANGRLFVNHVGVGIDGVVAERARAYGRYLGSLAGYAASAVSAILTFRPVPMTISVDGGPPVDGRHLLVVAANGRWFGGGMQCAPEAQPDDGWLDVLLVGDLPPPVAIRMLLRTYSGRHVDGQRVRAQRGRTIEIQLEREVPMELDGEVSRVRSLSVGLRPGVLRVLA